MCCLCTQQLLRLAVGLGVWRRVVVQICQRNPFPAFHATDSRRLPVFFGRAASSNCGSSFGTAISFHQIVDEDLSAPMLKDLASRLVYLDAMQVNQRRFGGGEYVTLFDLLFLPPGQLDHFLPQVLRLPDSVQ